MVGLVEIDKSCLSTLAANKKRAFPKAEIIGEDVSKISGRRLLKQTGIKKGRLDILSGGPPCQGFTIANKKRSIDDPRSKLMWHFVRLVGEMKPRYFVIENVPGLLAFKDFFFTLLESLEEKGYMVRFNELNASSYGVPQRRIRVLIDGARNDLKILPIFPEPTHFDLDNDKTFPPKSLVTLKCFSENGFSKEQVRDVWWNKKLNIMMNKKTAGEKVEQAVREILLEGLLKTDMSPLVRDRTALAKFERRMENKPQRTQSAQRKSKADLRYGNN